MNANERIERDDGDVEEVGGKTVSEDDGVPEVCLMISDDRVVRI